MAAGEDRVDEILSRSGREIAEARAERQDGDDRLSDDGPGRRLLPHRAFEADTEITGPSALKLFLSSKTKDADVFLVLQVFDPKGEEVVFYGALDPHTPVGQGWLRASHRKLDPKKTKPYRPYHTHDEVQPLKPGEPVELDIEIWPTCIVIPKGYRLGINVRGRDYEWAGAATTLSNMKNPMKGCGPFVHDDLDDRPPAVFDTTNTLHFAGRQAALSAAADHSGEIAPA